MGLRLKNGHLDNAKIKVKNAKLRNPDLVGMGVLVVASFSISRILYLLDIYYTPSQLGRQGKSAITAEAVIHEAWGLSLPAAAGKSKHWKSQSVNTQSKTSKSSLSRSQILTKHLYPARPVPPMWDSAANHTGTSLNLEPEM